MGTFKTPSVLSLNWKWTLSQLVLYACQTIRNRPRIFKRVPMHTLVQVVGILSIFFLFVNCYLINHKNSTPIKLKTCIVNVLCQLWVKYCTIQEFIVEHNLSIKFKDHSLPDYIYVKCFLCCKELTREVCRSILYTSWVLLQFLVFLRA